jgi:hypothetical protein
LLPTVSIVTNPRAAVGPVSVSVDSAPRAPDGFFIDKMPP